MYSKSIQEKVKNLPDNTKQSISDLQSRVDNISMEATAIVYDNTSNGLEGSNVQTVIDEIAACAIKGKDKLVSSIGSPVVASDSLDVMGGKIDVITEKFKTALTEKGVSVVEGDKLDSLVGKIKNLIDIGYFTGDKAPSSFIKFEDEILKEITMSNKLASYKATCVDNSEHFYIIDESKTLYKFSPTGDMLSQKTLTIASSLKKMVCVNGFIYGFINTSNILYKISTEDLSITKEYSMSQGIQDVSVYKDDILVAHSNAYVTLVNADLDDLWNVRLINSTSPTNSVSSNGDYIFASFSNDIYRLDPTNGSTMYKNPMNHFSGLTPSSFINDTHGVIYMTYSTTPGLGISVCDGNSDKFEKIQSRTSAIDVGWYSGPYFDISGYMYWGDRYSHKKIDTRNLKEIYDYRASTKDTNSIAITSHGKVFIMVLKNISVFQQYATILF